MLLTIYELPMKLTLASLARAFVEKRKTEAGQKRERHERTGLKGLAQKNLKLTNSTSEGMRDRKSKSSLLSTAFGLRIFFVNLFIPGQKQKRKLKPSPPIIHKAMSNTQRGHLKCYGTRDKTELPNKASEN